MPDADYLFVYGTLIRRLRHPMHRRMLRYASYLCDAVAEGELFDLGAYPAMRPGAGRVWGELYRIEDFTPLFRTLDRYEGSEYERRKIPVRCDGEERVDAWAYLYRHPLPPSRRIASGSYLAHRREGIR